LGFILTNDSPTLKAGYAVKYVEVVINGAGNPAAHGTPIAEFIKQREKNPAKAAALARARERLAARIGDSAQFSLTTLRLSKGISQSKLAELLDTQQPYIARLEKGDVDVMFSTIEKLAKALNVSIGEVAEAVRATREARLQTLI
jgi:ribosome-binding protein aMBF1 (putative translation factor)